MIGPWLYADRFAWSLTDTFAFIDDTFQQAAQHHGVEVRYLLGVNWSRPTEFINHAAAFAIQHANRNVAGLGFPGIEPAGGSERYTPAAGTVRANGLLIVPHIGETQGPQAIHAALAALTPHRTAHGVHATDDLRLLDQLTASAIPCDVCPTSNIRLGIYSDPADHPLSTLLKHGVTITLNADDPLLAATTFSDEYLQFSRSIGLSDRHMTDLAAGATAAGITDTTRTTLHTSITQMARRHRAPERTTMTSNDATQFQIQVTARALVTKNEDLLLVSNDGKIWYTPGGRLQPGESLPDCIQREVHEETGLHVSARELVHVFEYWEEKHQRHKVECYFVAHLESGELDQDWADLDGPVEHMRFFNPEQLQAEEHIYPHFLKEGRWRTGKDIYMGFER